MKLLLIGTILTFAFTLHAEEKKSLKCVNKAVIASVKHNFKSFGAGTGSCGIKLLHAGDFKETYIACTSDETDPMEYIVVMNSHKGCKTEYVGSTNEGSVPTFDSEDGLLNSISCSIDSGDKKLVCK